MVKIVLEDDSDGNVFVIDVSNFEAKDDEAEKERKEERREKKEYK